MPDSPISATPYEILGVNPSATDEELRRAYRRSLRQSHPDTGGTATKFATAQWAWEQIGTPESRAMYDRGRMSTTAAAPWSAPAAHRPSGSRPHARSYGHPGGWRRERFLTLVREWAGRGVVLDDPYDPALVRSAPRDIRHVLADALAEEATARVVADLGIAYTIWHDVATDAGNGGPEAKIDHIVLGPTGLFALLSEDWGDPVLVRKGEIVGEGLVEGERPMHDLAARARSVARAARVKFSAFVIVVPDDAIDEDLTVIGRTRGVPTVLVHRSRLPGLLRSGLEDTRTPGGNELFDLRTRLQGTIRFV
ncbi:MAG: DnaJ domain-containing protein [Burkholderiaceae bacterium]|nr:DnaJ domain-containing protein [Microbacteriaceae bacterium]